MSDPLYQCPSCSVPVHPGETICLECGTELAVTVDVDLEDAVSASEEVAGVAAPGEAAPAPGPADATICLECGERVSPDPNGLCPICGFDFDAPTMVRDADYHGAAATSQPAHSVDYRRFAGAADNNAPEAPVARGAAMPAAPAAVGTTSSEATAQAGIQLSISAPASPSLYVDGGQAVFFDGRMTSVIPLDVDQLQIGRRDPEVGHYPEVDLAHYRHVDPHLSRRHARVVREGSEWFVEDLCANDATWLNDRAHVLNRERARLGEGDRIIISDSIAFVFRTRARG